MTESKKDKKRDYSPFPIMPVGRDFNPQSINADSAGNTRVSPENRSEAGIQIRCMSCKYKAPEEVFMSDNKLVFEGCPECGQIDRGKMVYISDEGILPGEAHGLPQDFKDDFSDYVDMKHTYSKPLPVEHQLRNQIYW